MNGLVSDEFDTQTRKRNNLEGWVVSFSLVSVQMLDEIHPSIEYLLCEVIHRTIKLNDWSRLIDIPVIVDSDHIISSVAED